MHRFDTRFPTTPHSDVINHDGSVWDSESKLLQVTKRRGEEEEEMSNDTSWKHEKCKQMPAQRFAKLISYGKMYELDGVFA